MKNNFTPTSNALITIPRGLKPIDHFEKGDAVSAISVKLYRGKIKLSSSKAKISFNAGNQYQSNKMVYMTLDRNDTPYLVCNSNLPFLLPNGKYTRADKLFSGQEIVDKNGKSLKIDNLSIKNQKGSLPHISTNIKWDNTPNGHLLLVNDIVVGDFILQVYFDQLPHEMIQ